MPPWGTGRGRAAASGRGSSHREGERVTRNGVSPARRVPPRVGRMRSTLAAALLAGAVLVAATPAPAKQRPRPCYGRYVVETGKAPTVDPIIHIDTAGQITIRRDCAAAPAAMKLT